MFCSKLLVEFVLNPVLCGESVDRPVVAGPVNDVDVTKVELLDEVVLPFVWRCDVVMVCVAVGANELDNSLRCPYGQHLYKRKNVKTSMYKILQLFSYFIEYNANSFIPNSNKNAKVNM